MDNNKKEEINLDERESTEEQELWGEEAPLILPSDLKNWILEEDDDLLVMNKPGWVVCHPSKNGPWSSLVGACREYTGLERLHLVSRLDRETSGLVLLAKHKKAASFYQKAIESRNIQKLYLVILEGELTEPQHIDAPLARDIKSLVYVKQAVRFDRTSKSAETIFKPIETRGGYTLAEVELITGRKHQIRAHAEWMGNRVVGDKVYGPDATLYLEFIEKGWTDRLDAALPMKRQALHANKMICRVGDFERQFEAPLAPDMAEFWEKLRERR